MNWLPAASRSARVGTQVGGGEPQLFGVWQATSSWPVDDQSEFGQQPPFQGERWPGTIAQQPLPTDAVGGLNAHQGIDERAVAGFPLVHRPRVIALQQARRTKKRNSCRRAHCCTVAMAVASSPMVRVGPAVKRKIVPGASDVTILAPGAQPPGPPKEMAQLKGYEGSWVCQGNVPEGPYGPAHKSTTSVKIHGDLDGMWLSGRIDEAASTGNPHPFRGMMHMTYDTTAKNFLMLWVDNTGGWATQTSSGWEGEKMVWLGDGSMGDKKIMARDTFTKKGAELQHLGELQMDGKWVVVQDEVCKRPAPKK